MHGEWDATPMTRNDNDHHHHHAFCYFCYIGSSQEMQVNTEKQHVIQRLTRSLSKGVYTVLSGSWLIVVSLYASLMSR